MQLVEDMQSREEQNGSRHMPDATDARLTLAAPRQELFIAIARQRADIAACYHAAIVVLNDEHLPDRLSLAAHALRELLEKLPNDAMAVDTGADLNTKVNELRKPWEDVVAEEQAQQGAPWSHGVGKALRTFLDAVTNFFKARDAITTSRQEQAAAFLKTLEVSNVPLPADVQRRSAKEWMQMRRYFNNVAHHQGTPTVQEFQARVAQLEAFLSARLIPRPTADFERIDDLLKED
jgi:hypothetical protein